MVKFNSKQELVNARAAMYHEHELTEGNVFDNNSNRTSDLAECKEYASDEVTYIGAAYAKMFKMPFVANAWFIKEFGYCEA